MKKTKLAKQAFFSCVLFFLALSFSIVTPFKAFASSSANDTVGETEELCTVNIYGAYNDRGLNLELQVLNSEQEILESKFTEKPFKSYSFEAAPGQYKYVIKSNGNKIFEGQISIEKGEKKKDVYIKRVCFNVDDIIKTMDSSNSYGHGMNIIFNDENGETIKPIEDISIKNDKGGYDTIWYFIEAEYKKEYTYTYTAEMSDDKFFTDDSEKEYKFNIKMPLQANISPIRIIPSLNTIVSTIKISQNANAKLYMHQGVAYTELKEIHWNKQENNEGMYDVYKATCPADKNMIIVAGGSGTSYRKTAIYFNAPHADKEVTFDLDAQDSTPSDIESFVASDDLYTNIAGNYLTMNVGEEKQLEGFRVTQTVTNAITNEFIEPEMNYEIISGAEHIKLEPQGKEGRQYQKITAESTGTSIIKITYSDLCILDRGSLEGENESEKYYCNDINDLNTGIVIVNVGGSAGNIDSGIELTDYDTVYFPDKIIYPNGEEKEGNDSAVYSFTPKCGEDNVEVYTHEPITDKNATWTDSWTSCNLDDKGVCDIHLKEGRNIIKIISGNSILYKTINAKKVSIKIDNVTRPNKMPKIGESVSVSFTGLELPLYKMCGIYNPGYPDTTWVEYKIDNKTVRSNGIQYAIDKYNTIEFKTDQAGNIKLENGKIHCEHLGSALDSHHNIPLKGMKPNLNASTGTNNPYFCILPEIPLYVMGPEADVIEMIDNIDESDYLGEVKEIKEAQDAYDKLTDEQKKLVTNYAKLEKAYKAVEPVIKVINAIEKLPDRVTLDNKNAVDWANTKFAALTAIQQAAVYNQDKLKNLIANIQDLEEQKARIDHVINLIEYLPSVDKITLDKNVLEAITEAQAAYDKLPADERVKVTNADKLVQIQKCLPNLRAAQPVMDSIAAIGKITDLNYLDKAALVISARNAYDALTQEQQALVTNLDVLKQAEYDIALFEVDADVQEAMEAIRELTVTFDGQGNKIAGPLTQTAESGTETWEIWASWKDYVANTRGLIELIAADKLSEIENLADLEQAEAYISALEVDDAVKALASLPNADTIGESGAAAGTQLTAGDLKAIASAMDTYYNLTDEQKKSLPANSVSNLLALDQKASTYEEYLNDYLQVYVDELADCYVQYKDAFLSRTEMTVIWQIVNKYDSYTAENQAALDAMNASASTGLTFAEMRNVLLGQLAQVEEDLSASAGLDEWIMSLPTNVTIDNLESVENDIAAIEKQYYSLNKNAKSYIRNKERLNALKAVVSSLRDEVNTFTMNNPTLSAVATKYNSVTVSWDEYENAEYYYVYRKTGKKGWKRIAETATLSYIDQEVKCDTTYLYTVRAVSYQWGNKVLSDYDNGNVKVKTPFGGVTELTGSKSAGYNSVKLTWEKLDNAMGYRIYRASSKNGKFVKIKTIRSRNTQIYVDKGLTCGKTYYYKMRAYDKVGKKVVWASYSEIKSAKPIPAVTKIRKITSASKSAALTWKKVSGASGYVVYRASSKNGTYQKVKAVKGGKTLGFTDSKLKSKKTYYYKVRAYRKEGKKNIYSKYSDAKLIKID